MRPALAAPVSIVLALGGVLAFAAPASAAVDPWPGFDVRVSAPGQPSIRTGSEVYVHVDNPTSTFATVDSALPAALDIELRDSSSTALAGCTIPVGSTSCGLSTVQLAAGSQDLHLWASDGTSTSDEIVTFFGVTPADQTQTTPGLEWQDAVGVWHDGTEVGTPMLGDQVTAYRFLLTNNTNAPLHVNTYTLNGVASSVSVDIDAGATAYFPGGGPESAGTITSSVGASWSFADAAGYTGGNGTGGGVSYRPGSLALSTSTAASGATVTLTGTQFQAGDFDDFAVEFNSTPVPLGSVTADQAGNFTLAFTVPAGASSGAHHVVLLLGDYAIAALPLAIPGLAATGVDAMPYILIALGLLLAGVLALVIRAVVRRRS
jgi:hypothetical protein